MRRLVLLSLALLSLAPAAHAEMEAGNGTIKAGVSATSDYVVRGISRSKSKPSIGGDVTYKHDSGAYARVSGQTVSLRSDANAWAVVTPAVGYTDVLYNYLTVDGGLEYNSFVGGDNDLDYWELYLSGMYDFDVLKAGLEVAYSPEYISNSGFSAYYGGNVSVPLPYDVTAVGHLGFQYVDNERRYVTSDYTDWGVGLRYNYQGMADLRADYTGTNLDKNECAERCGQRLTVGVGKRF